MRAKIALALAASIVAAFAWAFWHFLGDDATSVMLILALAGVSADNVRLRRKLGKPE